MGHLARRKDLTGQKFGKLTVVEMLYNYKRKKGGQPVTYCRCLCDCGNEVIRQAQKLKTSKLPSCGCAKYEIIKNKYDNHIEGQKFGRLTAIETLWGESPLKVRCLCDCGNEVIVAKTDLTTGHTKSCGCLQADRVSEVNTKDITGKANKYGITAIKPLYQNDYGVWIWQFKCTCGNLFEGLPAKIFSDTRPTISCGCINQSLGEKIVEDYFVSHDINYKTQVSFDDCVYKYVLKFDFGVYDSLWNLKALVEYDGKQHYMPVDYFGGIKSFKENQKRDQIKNNYCKRNNIDLYRIPYVYDADDIRNILSNIIYA